MVGQYWAKNKSLQPDIVASDNFNRKRGANTFPLAWQWNHNPVAHLWSLTERKGYLRLKTDRVDTSFVMARKTITQRTFGPTSSASTLLDTKGMKEGDQAGLCLLQKNYGLIGVKVDQGKKMVYMVSSNSGKPVTIASVPISSEKIYFRADCDFTERKDLAQFYYSMNGKNWIKMGEPIKMPYTLPHFMGYRFGLYCYATSDIGGYADFDWYKVGNQLIKN